MAISRREYERRMQKAFANFQKKLQKESIESALRMESDAQLNATTYPRVRTGRLRNSIMGKVKQKQDDIHIFVQAGFDDSGIVEYAEYVEYGTKNMKPRFFMRRAARKEQKRIVPVFKKVIRDTLKGQ